MYRLLSQASSFPLSWMLNLTMDIAFYFCQTGSLLIFVKLAFRATIRVSRTKYRTAMGRGSQPIDCRVDDIPSPSLQFEHLARFSGRGNRSL